MADPSRTNMAKMKLKLKGQLDVVEYSRITVPESVRMGDPADGYMEMVKARHFSRWVKFRSNLKRKKYGTVMSSEANENGLELLNKVCRMVALQKYFDETMAYIANPCVRTHLQVRLMWCLIGIRKWEYGATIETKAKYIWN